MKKVYLMALAALFGSASMAQVSVTFQVDMNGETVSPNGVHVAGNWQDEAGFPDEWNPATSEMTDDNADGIYELTVTVPPGDYEYKFINDNAWGADEAVPLVNQRGGGNQNRVFMVSQWHADNGGYTLPAYVFGGSAPVGQVALRLQIDMANQDVDENVGVHVAGSFSDPVWTPQLSKAWQVEDSIYAFVANVPINSPYEYKFLNGDFWGTDETVPAECATNDNRFVAIGDVNVITDAYCFGTCELCEPLAPPVSVTFRVNMTLETVSPNGVHVAGNWQAAAGFGGDWQPGASEMTDADSDGIYELEVMIPPGVYEYKFVNGNDWGFEEGVPAACNTNNNRVTTVEAGVDNFAEACFSQCEFDCVVNPDPANIVFSVDMSEETVSPDGVYLIGNFTDPQWQGGAIQMSDDNSDDIYEATALVSGPAEFNYKFVNGIPVAGQFDNEEFNGNTEQLSCNVPSGNPNGWNRVHVRSGEPEELGFIFGTCNSILSTTDLELGRVAIYPNPSSGVTFLEVENPNNHTLRMNIVDITGKTVTENMVINTNRFEINTTNLNSGLYFLNIVNERSETAVYKLMVK